MEKISLTENKYTRVINIISLKTVLWELDPEDFEPVGNLVSDINLLIEHELALLDSELLHEERLKINHILYDTKSHPNHLFFTLIKIVEPERTNLLAANILE